MQYVCISSMVYGLFLLCISSKCEHFRGLKIWKHSKIFWLEPELDQKDKQTLIYCTLIPAKLNEPFVRLFRMHV